MKIIIETKNYQAIGDTKFDSDVGVAQTEGLKVSLEDIDPGAKSHLEEAVLGLQLVAFTETLDRFLENHGCKDCPVYNMYNSMLRHLQVIQKQTMEELGEEDRLL